MGRKKAPKAPKQRSSTTPWAPQGAQLQNIYDMAQQQAKVPLQYYPGGTIAPFSQETQQALQLIRNRAIAGSPVQKAAQEELAKTLRGDYLSGPVLQQRFETAARDIVPQITSQFARGGRARGGGLEVARTRALGDAFSNLLGQERQNMLSTLNLAPTIANMDYENFQKLAGVGARREDLHQRILQDAVARHMFAQEEPSQRLARYSGIVQGSNWGGNQVGYGPQQPGQSRWVGGLGGGLVGAGAGSFFGPIGAGIGALGGGLLGAFG